PLRPAGLDRGLISPSSSSRTVRDRAVRVWGPFLYFRPIPLSIAGNQIRSWGAGGQGGALSSRRCGHRAIARCAPAAPDQSTRRDGRMLHRMRWVDWLCVGVVVTLVALTLVGADSSLKCAPHVI